VLKGSILKRQTLVEGHKTSEYALGRNMVVLEEPWEVSQDHGILLFVLF
jgi:hypothetical protein